MIKRTEFIRNVVGFLFFFAVISFSLYFMYKPNTTSPTNAQNNALTNEMTSSMKSCINTCVQVQKKQRQQMIEAAEKEDSRITLHLPGLQDCINVCKRDKNND